MKLSRLFLLFGAVAAFGLPAMLAEDKDDAPPTDAASAAVQAPLRELGTTTESEAPAGAHKKHRGHGDESASRDIVAKGDDAVLNEGEAADNVVAILGSARAAGTVIDSVVSVFGSSTATGKVGDSVVSVFGNTQVDGPVGGDVVAVGGGVVLGPHARVEGSVVSIGAAIQKESGAEVKGDNVQIAVFNALPQFAGLHAWFHHALRWGRPLAIGRDLGWVWTIAMMSLGFYCLLAWVAGKEVTRCADSLNTRPGKVILATLLTLLMSPLLLVLLTFTVIGPLVFVCALVAGWLYGKTVFAAWLGRRLGQTQPVLAVVVGALPLCGLYLVPFVGFLAWLISGMLGLGMVVDALITSVRREKTATADKAPGPISSPLPPSVVEPTSGASAMNTPTDIATSAPPVVPPIPPVLPPPAAPLSPTPPPATNATVHAAATWPRAGFWIRLAALVLDLLLVSIACSGVHAVTGSSGFPLLFAIYCVALWSLKGTSIGGIVFGLKIVRLDDRPVDITIALVRALAGFLSIFAAGIGFIWVAFDRERQTWHDKIAGTTVVRVPKGVSLI